MATLKASAPRSYQLIQTLHAIDPDVTGKATKQARQAAEAEYQGMTLEAWEAHVASEAAFYARMVVNKARMLKAYEALEGVMSGGFFERPDYRKMYQHERVEAYLARRAARKDARHAA
jgi:hypothetical protein